MNPHAEQSLSPVVAAKSIIKNKSLIYSLAKREVIGRYRGSVMGLMWSFFNPLLMLVIYTFVFSVVFKAHWTGGGTSKTEFALVLFSGLLVFNILAESLNRAPGLILSNVNYVKKVIFPLEVLPVVAMLSTLFHFMISLLVWLIFYLIFFGMPHLSIIELPVILLPLVLLTLGVSWFLASLGVYLRDVGQIISVVTTILMFLSPIFFPVSSMPVRYQPFMQISPLTFAVEQARNIMIWEKPVNWIAWEIWIVISCTVAWLGFAWFQKTRKGFADVL